MDEFLEKNGYNLLFQKVSISSREEEIHKEMITLGFHADDLVDVFFRLGVLNNWLILYEESKGRGVIFAKECLKCPSLWVYLESFDGVSCITKFQRLNELYRKWKKTFKNNRWLI